jgi:hypothetical protein
VVDLSVYLRSEVSSGPLVATQFTETMELLHVQGLKSNIWAVGYYLRADRPFESKNDRFDLVLSSTERYGVQLSVETVPVWILWVELEIMSSNQTPGTQTITPAQREKGRNLRTDLAAPQ